MIGSGCGSNEYTDDDWQRMTRAQKIAAIQAVARDNGDDMTEERAAAALDLGDDFDRGMLYLKDSEKNGAPPGLI